MTSTELVPFRPPPALPAVRAACGSRDGTATSTARSTAKSLPGRLFVAASGTAGLTVAALLGPLPEFAAAPGTVSAVLLLAGTYALIPKSR